MTSIPISVELVIFWLIMANLFSVVGYALVVKWKARRRERNIARINAAILEHFKKSGVTVSVDCVNFANDDKRYTAFVESEPMKRFRLSHIIEMMLRQHVAKTCGLTLEKIYWRFPIKEAESDNRARNTDTIIEKQAPEAADEYINEGLVNYRDLPKADVSEIPWEKFEEVASDTTAGGGDKDSSR